MTLSQQFSPGISVLMSVYAKERPEYLASALDSLYRQSRPAEQVVLVCDGALTPELDAVIQHFGAVLPLSVLRLPANVGLSHALNAGLPLCEREWVARFDSDDICEENRFARQLEYADTHPEVDVFGAYILEFATDGAVPDLIRVVKQTHDEIVDAARFRNPLNHVTVMFRTAVVVNAGGYPHDIQNEDYALWFHLMSEGFRFANIPEPLVRVRAGVDMASRRGGWFYLVAEFKLQTRFRQLGFIDTPVFLFNLALRVAIRLSPNSLRRHVYTQFLRVRSQASAPDRASASKPVAK